MEEYSRPGQVGNVGLEDVDGEEVASGQLDGRAAVHLVEHHVAHVKKLNN